MAVIRSLVLILALMTPVAAAEPPPYQYRCLITDALGFVADPITRQRQHRRISLNRQFELTPVERSFPWWRLDIWIRRLLQILPPKTDWFVTVRSISFTDYDTRELQFTEPCDFVGSDTLACGTGLIPIFFDLQASKMMWIYPFGYLNLPQSSLVADQNEPFIALGECEETPSPTQS